MKRREFLGASAAAGLGLVGMREAGAATAGSRQGKENGQAMRAGFARVKISPPLKTRMMGLSTRDLSLGCLSIHDDIYVRALFLEAGGQQALIMGFDLFLIGRPLVDRMKGAIERQIDIAGQQILLNASHSHMSPATGTWYAADYEPQDLLYRRDLVEATVQAACEARDAMREVTLWTGVTSSVLPVSRRKPNGKGGILWAPNREGTAYDRLPICMFEDRAGKPVCLLFSVSADPAIVSRRDISAEYPGVAMRFLDEHLGATCSLFLQGVGGDANPRICMRNDQWHKGKWPEMGWAGSEVAKPVIQALSQGLTQVEPELRSAYIETLWPLEKTPPRSEFEAIASQPDSKKLSVRNRIRWLWARKQLQLLKRGQKLTTAVPIAAQGIQLAQGVRLFALEGAPVAQWGHTIDQFFGGGTTFPLGYSNGQGLCLPVSSMLPEGGYEVDSYWEYGFPAKLAPGMESIVQEALVYMRGQGIA